LADAGGGACFRLGVELMGKRSMGKTSKTKKWEDLPDEAILAIRVRDLNLQVAGSPLEPLIGRLREELDGKGIKFHPPCYLADEWVCPDKMPIIGIPFCLAHRRLKEIERKIMFEVEGNTEEACMKLLRHECGHALNYAYELYKRTRWRQLFGPFSARYCERYYFQPYSRRYVQHLDGNYAQAHPDEDFAETFAVWLAPARRWEQKYRKWPVIKKLRYVESVMARIADSAPTVVAKGTPPWSASRMTSTLGTYYERKRRALGPEFQGFYDDSLKRIFAAKASGDSQLRASQLVRRHRRELVDSVTRCTGHRKFDIHHLVKRLMVRCGALGLYAKSGAVVGLTALVTAIASNTLRVTTTHKER